MFKHSIPDVIAQELMIPTDTTGDCEMKYYIECYLMNYALKDSCYSLVQEALSDAFEQLAALGAVFGDGTSTYQLTDLGRRMAVFPVDPKLSRMIIGAIDER